MMEPDRMTDDEMLSAWLDDELSPDDARRLERRLAAEPMLAQRLAQIQAAEESVQRVFHAVDETPLPQAVVDLLEERDAARSWEAPGANVVRMPPRPRFFQAPVAIAASVALVAGFLVHDLVVPGARDDAAFPASGVIAQGSGLYRTLETAPAAEPVVLDDGGNAEVVLTFRATDGAWCRQFRLRGEAAAMHGLACRQAGGWRLETASFAAPGSPDDTFQQAAGTTPEALEAAVRARLGSGTLLDADAEIKIISKGWGKSR